MSAHRLVLARRMSAATWAGGIIAAGALALAGPAGIAFASPGGGDSGVTPVGSSCVPGESGCSTHSLFGPGFSAPTPGALAATVVVTRPQSCGVDLQRR
jgi:hypothetical protein